MNKHLQYVTCQLASSEQQHTGNLLLLTNYYHHHQCVYSLTLLYAAITLWRPLLPYGYSYKASRVTLG